MADTVKTADETIIFALGHPLRVDALRILNKREASVAELARELGENPKKVGNHVKVLLEHRFIQWTRSEKNRGAEEHFYRGRIGTTSTSISDLEQMGPLERSEYASHLLVGTIAEALAGFREGSVDLRLERCARDLSNELVDHGRAEMHVLLDEARLGFVLRT
jgi:DNA-binding transcriptional ArsR family regulator